MGVRIVIAILLSAILCACGGASRLPEGALYLPADAALVLAFDLPAVRSTDLYRELQERGGTVGLNRLNLMKFAQAAGLDPLRDIGWVTFVGRAHATEGPPIDELSALVTGTFDGTKMRRVLKESGMPSTQREGVDIFEMVIVEGRCRFCIAVFDERTAAFGDGDTLAAMADARSDRAKSLEGDAGIHRLLVRVDPRAAIWGLARGRDLSGPLAGLVGQVQQSGPLPAALQSVKDLSIFVVARETVTVVMDAMASSPQDALLVGDVLEGAGAAGRLALKQAKPDAAGLLSAFEVQVDGSLVRASASFPSERLVAMVGNAADGFFGAPGMFRRFGAGSDAGPGAAAPSEPGAQPPAR